MKTEEKYYIHTIQVAAAGEKKLFQIKLPRNAKKITGILITVRPVYIVKGRPKEPPFPIPFPRPIIAEPIAVLATDTVAAVKAKVAATPLIPIEHAI